MTTDFRALCVELTEALRRQHDWYIEDNGATLPQVDELVVRAETTMAESDGPAVSDDREPASVVSEPSDRELLELMPETMRDEFAYAATTCSDATGGQVKPRIFRVCLNTAALEYARAVLDRWGTSNLKETRSSLGAAPAVEGEQ